MSGGSFNYLYTKDAGELFVSQDLRDMRQFLASEFPQSRAAIHTSTLVDYLDGAASVLETESTALTDVWHAAEWYKSSDYGRDKFAAAVDKFEKENTP